MSSSDAISSCWYKWTRKSDTLLIVEDQVSAIKLARHYHSLALLGTNLSDAKVEEIAAENYEHVYLCLDNDATWEAIKTVLRCKQKLPNLQMRGLLKDVKNMDDDELEEFLGLFSKEK